jgi:hypothetical protein
VGVVVLLSAIALNRVALGLVLIVAFSLGLAFVLIAIGMMMLYTRRLMDRFDWEGERSLLRRLPVVSSAVIALLGVVIAVQSLAQGGILQIPSRSASAAAPRPPPPSPGRSPCSFIGRRPCRAGAASVCGQLCSVPIPSRFRPDSSAGSVAAGRSRLPLPPFHAINQRHHNRGGL